MTVLVLQQFTGRVATTDFANNGDVNLYVVGTDDEPNAIYNNDRSGTFYDTATEALTALTSRAYFPAG